MTFRRISINNIVQYGYGAPVGRPKKTHRYKGEVQVTEKKIDIYHTYGVNYIC